MRILCGHGVKPLQLGRLVQSLNARLFARAWRLIAPPELLANSCLLVLGSEGRGEQILKTDQDNALLLRDGASWPQLEASCQAFSDALERFGYPPCPGGIMLSRPGWRFSGAELRERFHQWVHQPSGDALMRLAIFVDAEAVCGDSELLSARATSCMRCCATTPAFSPASPAPSSSSTPRWACSPICKPRRATAAPRWT